MRLRFSNIRGLRAVILALITIVAPSAAAQKVISCPDGEHIKINIQEISIKYDASSFAGTLSSLGALSGRFDFSHKTIQEAAAATQQWDEFLKGLVAGYNSCAITREQYADGVTRIYPRLKEDAIGLDQIRKLVAAGQRADAKQIGRLINSFNANLKMFAVICGKEIILQRIEALSDQVAQVATGTKQILDGQAVILQKMDELSQLNKQAPLPSPGAVAIEVHKTLSARASDAEVAYSHAYELMDRYRFREAIPYLQQAKANVPIPEFYDALGRAYSQIPDIEKAESAFRNGLALPMLTEMDIAQLSEHLGWVLSEKGDLAGALQYTQSAFKIVAKHYGANSVEAAVTLDNIARILREQGSLDEALTFTMRVLNIEEKTLDPYSIPIATAVNHIGLILAQKGELDGAMQYTLRALDIDKKIYGSDNHLVAINSSIMGQIFLYKGDLKSAMEYARMTLDIDEKVFGPDHPTVAVDLNNIAQILQAKRDLDGALDYTKRALKIDENVYGSDHYSVATRLNNIGEILEEQGDLDGALKYTKRAFDIDKDTYGPNHPTVATIAANIAEIFKASGNLDQALLYGKMALPIFEKTYGLNDGRTRNLMSLINEIQRARASGVPMQSPK